MSSAHTGISVRLVVVTLGVALAFFAPGVARAQDHWTGIGAINGTVMYMDTTSLERVGELRKVWIRSIDIEPKTVVAGKDSLTFDTVIALNVFDCSKGTRTIAHVLYMLGPDSVLDVPETRADPEQLRSTSFFGAIYSDLCRPDHKPQSESTAAARGTRAGRSSDRRAEGLEWRNAESKLHAVSDSVSQLLHQARVRSGESFIHDAFERPDPEGKMFSREPGHFQMGPEGVA